jgi:hypothetical protein
LIINLLHIGGLLPTKVTLIWYNDLDFILFFVIVTAMLDLIVFYFCSVKASLTPSAPKGIARSLKTQEIPLTKR